MKLLLGIIKKFFRSYKTPISTMDIRSILIVDLNHIGDMLMSSPVYRALSENIPTVRIHALIYPSAKMALDDNPYIESIHELHEGVLLMQIRTLFKLRKQNYDLVFQLNTSLRTNFLMWIIGKRFRLGYDYANRGCFNNIHVPIACRTTQSQYRVDECIELLEKAFGWRITNRSMIFNIRDEHIEKVNMLLKSYEVSSDDLLIGIQTNCHPVWKERRWDRDKFASLSDSLIERYRAKIIFTGSTADREYVQPIIDSIRNRQSAVNLVGETTLTELGALLRRINVFITINTGPMQIAISQNTPTIALMGVTPHQITFPMNNPIFQHISGSEFIKDELGRFHAQTEGSMNKIEVVQVIEKVRFLLEK
ncbi:MAG: glycosyltransferase family 9 protein [Bacteroidota bacterium]|nr:glycosyltransferase family 9 protein [Bacteroidota bacterium]